MFNIGGGELLVIMLIALIVLGPQRLPDAARQIGKTMGELRRLSAGFQNEMKSALDTADDPNRVATRRNVLAKDEVPGAVESPAAAAIAAVSSQPSTPDDAPVPDRPKRRTLTAAPIEPKPEATRKNGTEVRRPAAKKVSTGKASATKRASPAAPKAPRRRPT